MSKKKQEEKLKEELIKGGMKESHAKTTAHFLSEAIESRPDDMQVREAGMQIIGAIRRVVDP